MPLTHLGQLEPTMEQQIALQRALLKLIREDEELRRKAAEKPVGKPTGEPALARRLGGAPGAFPETGWGEEPAFKGGMEYAPLTDWSAVQERALTRQLKAAEPTPGYISGEERMRMARERIAGEREELAGKAGEFWERITPLDDEGRKVALDAAREFQPELYDALIEQGFVDPTTGEAVRPEDRKKPMTRDTHVEDGWLYEDILYDDGTSTHEIIGRAPEGGVAAPTISEAVSLEKLGIAKEEHAERFRSQAIDIMGDMPRPGIDTITVDGKEVIATAEHANAWIEGVTLLTAFLSGEAGEVPPGGELTMEDVKSMYEGRPDLISDVQQSLGVPVTGIWDEETEFAFGTYGDVLLAGEPTKEGEVKPRFERQKKFWGEWVKKWGKTFTGVTKAIKGVK